MQINPLVLQQDYVIGTNIASPAEFDPAAEMAKSSANNIYEDLD